MVDRGQKTSGPIYHLPTANPRARLSHPPDRADAGREAAAHVEGQVALRALDLPVARLAGELDEHLVELANARRADGMAVAHQAAARVHWEELARAADLPEHR